VSNSLDPMAYLLAKSHGMTEECESILEISGLTEDQISLPTMGSPLQPPKPIVPTFKANWPVKAASHSFFEKALRSGVDGLGDDAGAATNGFGADDVEEEETSAAKGGLPVEDEEEDAAGWDMGDDINVEVENDFVNVENVEGGAGSSEADMWWRHSPLAADHAAGGSFETAMNQLNRQVGAVNFKPLKPRFLEIYQASKTYLPASVGLPPLVNYVRRTVDETDSRKIRPIIPRDIESVASADLQEGYTAMRGNKLEDGVAVFKRILHTVLVNAVGSENEVREAKKIITTAMEYTVAMSIELERRSVGTDSDEKLKRSLELSAYFTIPKLEVAHRNLALMAAMKLAFANKNFSSSLSFANRMLANGGAPKLLEQVSSSSFHLATGII
jgi:coatomer subunit alpha